MLGYTGRLCTNSQIDLRMHTAGMGPAPGRSCRACARTPAWYGPVDIARHIIQRILSPLPIASTYVVSGMRRALHGGTRGGGDAAAPVARDAGAGAGRGGA